MSTLLLNLSKKVLKFFCKIREGGEGGGKGGELWKSTWAFRKKICQRFLGSKLALPRAFPGKRRVGKCQKCARKAGSPGQNGQ